MPIASELPLYSLLYAPRLHGFLRHFRSGGQMVLIKIYKGLWGDQVSVRRGLSTVEKENCCFGQFCKRPASRRCENSDQVSVCGSFGCSRHLLQRVSYSSRSKFFCVYDSPSLFFPHPTRRPSSGKKFLDAFSPALFATGEETSSSSTKSLYVGIFSAQRFSVVGRPSVLLQVN